MKTKEIFIVVALVSVLFSCDLLKKEEVKILNDNLVTKTKSGMDLESASMAKQLTNAKIEGTVKNVSEKTLKNIVITYKIGRTAVTAKIASLKPDQKIKFTTTGYKSNQKNPKYHLESITYKE
jgi:hypothetical protein